MMARTEKWVHCKCFFRAQFAALTFALLRGRAARNFQS
jgi:hypothetical protein